MKIEIINDLEYVQMKDIKEFCLKEYNINLSDSTIKMQSPTFIKKSRKCSYVEWKPIAEFCKKYRYCLDNYKSFGDMQKIIQEKYNIIVGLKSMESVAEIEKLNRKLIFIKNADKVIEYYSTSKEERIIATKKTKGINCGKLAKESRLKKLESENLMTIPMIAKELNCDRCRVEHILEHLNIPIQTTNIVVYVDKSYMNQIKEFFNEIKDDDYFFYRDTCMKKFGCENPSLNKEIKMKKKLTSLKNYGVENYMHSDIGKKYFSNISRLNAKSRMSKRLNTLKNMVDNFESINNCISIKHVIEKYNLSYSSGYLCEITRRLNMNYTIFEGNMFISINDVPKILEYKELASDYCTSYSEKELVSFIKSIYDGKIIENSRKIISPKELDIFIPEKKVAIEFNGLYFHNSEHVENNYHINKTIDCEKQGIRLIHVFEDDWNFKNEICKSIIASSLGAYKEKYFARSCEIEIIHNNTAKDFLNKNHIQGAVNSVYCFALTCKGEIVQVATFGKNRFKKNEIELLRMCTKLNTQVVGGFSKLIKHAHEHMNISRFISYVDRGLFNASGYQSIGFNKISESKPSYHYVSCGGIIRENRMKYQKHKLSNILEFFNPELSEYENMKNNGYYRIYDCGTIKMLYKK